MWHLLIGIIIIITKPGFSRITGSCPIDWTEYSGHCYYVSTGPVTWYNAQEYCGNKGARLTSIVDVAEKDFIASITDTSKTNYWIDLEYATSEPWCWTWTDRSALLYEYWNLGEPDGSGRCGRIGTNDKWRDTNCNSTLSGGHNIGYICRKDAEPVINPTPEGTPLESTTLKISTLKSTTLNIPTLESTVGLATNDRGATKLSRSLVIGIPLIVLIPIAIGAIVLLVVCLLRKKSARDSLDSPTPHETVPTDNTFLDHVDNNQNVVQMSPKPCSPIAEVISSRSHGKDTWLESQESENNPFVLKLQGQETSSLVQKHQTPEKKTAVLKPPGQETNTSEIYPRGLEKSSVISVAHIY